MKKPKLLPTIALLAICLACLGVVVWKYPGMILGRELAVDRSEGGFSIDSRTILQSISTDGEAVFRPMTSTPEPSAPDTEDPVQWTQDDYLMIADALHQHVWGDGISDWHLHYMQFQADCGVAEWGPQRAYLGFWKLRPNGLGQTRVEHVIRIRPLQNWVSWTEVRSSPAVERWPTLDVRDSKVDVSAALILAEANGGRVMREAHRNDCWIWQLLPDPVVGFPHVWKVQYTGPDLRDLLEVRVNAITGEIE